MAVSRARSFRQVGGFSRRKGLRFARGIAERIAAKFHPERIILFGSWAYGEPSPESDFDFLVTFSKRQGAGVTGGHIRVALGTTVSMDIVVRTERELARRMRLGDFFMKEIVSRGRVLYEAPHS